jgi:glycosyltransferase involved in cell wall biosynthesis
VPGETVSVVVPTRNSAATLAACLQSIRGQTHSPLELFIVDNHSEDTTVEIAEGLADVVVIAGPERSAQRNEGARRSTGDYLLFIDSDMVLAPKVVEECVEATLAGGLVAVVIPEESFGQGFWARRKAFERSFYVGDDTIEAARFFPRVVFEVLGGFDEWMPAGPEDWDLHQRAAAVGPVGRTSALIRHDEGSPTLRGLMAKKYYYGKGIDSYRRRHPEAAKGQLRLIRPAFVRGRARLARQPFLAGTMLLMKSAEFAAGGLGVLSSRLSARAGDNSADGSLEGESAPVPREPRA